MHGPQQLLLQQHASCLTTREARAVNGPASRWQWRQRRVLKLRSVAILRPRRSSPTWLRRPVSSGRRSSVVCRRGFRAQESSHPDSRWRTTTTSPGGINARNCYDNRSVTTTTTTEAAAMTTTNKLHICHRLNLAILGKLLLSYSRHGSKVRRIAHVAGGRRRINSMLPGRLTSYIC